MLRVLLTIVTLAILGGLALIVLRGSRTLHRRVWLTVLTLILGGGVSMMAAHAFVAKWAFMGDHPRHGLMLLMDGTAHRPFVYRRLSPALVRVATDAAMRRLPGPAVDYFLYQSPLRRYRENWSGTETWTPRKAIAFHFAYVLLWAGFFGTLLIGAALIQLLQGANWLHSLVTATIATCLLPLVFVGGGYVYDATELLLWFALLYCLLRNWVLIVPLLFALMLVNKESSLIIVPSLFPIFHRRAGFKSASLWTALLGAMGIAWIAYVRREYAGTPGAPMEFWLPDNLAFWSLPGSYFSFAQLHSPALLSPRGGNVLTLLLLLIPMRYGWSIVRADLRHCTALLALALFPLFVAYSFKDEIRNLSLLYPMLFVVSAAGVQRLFSPMNELTPRDPGSSRGADSGSAAKRQTAGRGAG